MFLMQIITSCVLPQYRYRNKFYYEKLLIVWVMIGCLAQCSSPHGESNIILLPFLRNEKWLPQLFTYFPAESNANTRNEDMRHMNDRLSVNGSARLFDVHPVFYHRPTPTKIKRTELICGVSVFYSFLFFLSVDSNALPTSWTLVTSTGDQFKLHTLNRLRGHGEKKTKNKKRQ